MRLEGMNVFFQCLFEVIREILIGDTFQPLLKFSNELPLGGHKRRPHSFRPALRGPCSELRRLGFELRESSRLEGRAGGARILCTPFAAPESRQQEASDRESSRGQPIPHSRSVPAKAGLLKRVPCARNCAGCFVFGPSGYFAAHSQMKPTQPKSSRRSAQPRPPQPMSR